MKILVPLLLASVVTAQSYYIPDNVATTGGSNVIPFGHNSTNATWQNQKYQSAATPADLGNKAVLSINDLAFASVLTGIRHFDEIEIVMAQTNSLPLSTTFSTNLVANVQTVLSAKNFDVVQEAGKWNRIGLDKPYLYIAAQGANLVLQITVKGAGLITSSTAWPGHRTGSRQRVYAFNWTGSPPATGSQSSTAAVKWEVNSGMNDLSQFGQGCKGSNGVVDLSFTGTAKLGGSATIDLANAPANAVNALIVDLKRFEPGIKLAAFGAPDCSMYLNNAITVFGVASAQGGRSIPVTIPTAGVGLQIFTQFFISDRSANRFGWTTSNYGRMLLGN